MLVLSGARILRLCDAMCGTELVYGPMQYAVLCEAMALCNVRYCARLWPYAMCGAGAGYGPMRCA
eukprot:1409445-Rhodomonas_salina.1